jgi:Transposase zinc-binding domain
MNRPILEVADIVRAAGNSFWERYGSRLAWPHRKVLDAIVRCRTKALGGHLDQCVRCGHQAISYNSCRNRHCPRCQGKARARWLAARSAELLPVPYFHIVFTLPHEFSALILQNKRLLYDLLFRTSAATLTPKIDEYDVGGPMNRSVSGCVVDETTSEPLTSPDVRLYRIGVAGETCGPSTRSTAWRPGSASSG